MTDEEIVDAVKDKHGIPLATGVYRQAHLDLVSMARVDERHRIVAWLRANNAEICDWFPNTIAEAIIDREHSE